MILKVKLIEEIIENHKAKGYNINFLGWNLHKWDYYCCGKEYLSVDKLTIYGIKHIKVVDMSLSGEVECAGCKKMLTMPCLVYGNIHNKLIYCYKCNEELRRAVTFELRHHSWLDIDAFEFSRVHQVLCTSRYKNDEALLVACQNTNDMNTYFKEHSCIMFPSGMLPSTLRARWLAQVAVKRWRNPIIKRKVAYVLYNCIPKIDVVTAKALAEHSC
jgi:hypothetical protein